MKHIIVGTDRQDSNSAKVAHIVQKIYQDLGETTEILDLKDFRSALTHLPAYGEALPPELKPFYEKVTHSEGLIMVVPEYNGSIPGILKYFIDYMKYPDDFEFRPVSFIGLGGRFGGLRPVEHLQQVFGYRNAFIYPVRVFMTNVFKMIEGDKVTDPVVADLMVKQAKGFQAYCRALKSQNLDANSQLSLKKI